MEENIINDALVEAEGEYTITLLNKVTGTFYEEAAVTEANTVRQILEEYYEDLGLNKNSNKILFENKRTHVSTSDPDTTLKKLDLRSGDVLAITDEGGVA